VGDSMLYLENYKKNVWNKEIEVLLKQKQIECTKYSILHNIDSEKYNNYYNYLFIANAFLTSLSGTSVIMSNALFSDMSPQTTSYINISFGILLIFATALSSFQHMTNYSEKSRNHKDASAKFTSLGNNMLKLLALDKASKETSMPFWDWSDREFTNLQIQSPNPSNYAYKLYKADNPPQLFQVKISNSDSTEEINFITGINQIKSTEGNHGENEDNDEINESLEEEIDKKSKQTIMDFNKKRFANNMYI
jgi:hypothetical protein